jgi:hypothetical protein
MMYGEAMAFCCDSATTATDTLFGHNVDFVNVEPVGSCGNHQILKGSYNIALLVFVACHVHIGMFIFISEIILLLLLSL